MLPQIQNGIATYAVERNVAANVAVADTHWHQANVHAASRREAKAAGDDFTFDAYCGGA